MSEEQVAKLLNLINCNVTNLKVLLFINWAKYLAQLIWLFLVLSAIELNFEIVSVYILSNFVSEKKYTNDISFCHTNPRNNQLVTP